MALSNPHGQQANAATAIRQAQTRIPYKKVDVDLPKIPEAQPRPKDAAGGLRAGQLIPSHY